MFDSQDRLRDTAQSALATLDRLYSELNEAKGDRSHWTGELSASALSTATAVSALSIVVATRHGHWRYPPAVVTRWGARGRESAACDEAISTARLETLIEGGVRWLLAGANPDGGYGDTDRSHSNIATTLLAISALELSQAELTTTERDQTLAACQSAWRYVEAKGKWDGLRARYGKDKTFVVPILSNCALAGLVPWTQVPTLPFEAAWLPQEWYRWAQMPVVSYAIPALVAIGQARFHFAPPRNPMLRVLRRRAIAPTLQVLRRMQPASGGYLEAVPLTSFVLMSLAAVGNGSLPVAQDCLRFLLDSRLNDNTWPIDTNLATWGTSLAIHALSRPAKLRITTCDDAQHSSPNPTSAQTESASERALAAESISVQGIRWLLSCQHSKKHPFTGATPGGWGWTDLSGAVPDADDTPAALLALRSCEWNESPNATELLPAVHHAVGLGLSWLLRLQNRDGGWPTFCKGWGKLPFDRSGTDLTAHALRAIEAWLPALELSETTAESAPSIPQLQRAKQRGLKYLTRQQQSDGSWLPLWFGNQDREAEDNPTYGTGKVLLAYATLGRPQCQEAERGIHFLRSTQNRDGGWGGGFTRIETLGPGQCREDRSTETSETDLTSSLEETAVALEGLLECCDAPLHDPTILKGLCWLANAVQNGGLLQPSPIGFYFAKLWYYEKLYPALFSLSAFGVAMRCGSEAKSLNPRQRNLAPPAGFPNP